MREGNRPGGIETEVGSTSEFEDEVLSTIRAKERGSAFTDIAGGRVDIASQIWADFDTNFSQRLEAIDSSDLDLAMDAWSEAREAITSRSSRDPERAAAWLAMCAADIKTARALADSKPSHELPERLTAYMRSASPQFTEQGVREGNVSVDMRVLAEAKPLTVDMVLEALSVNQSRDGIEKGDPEYEALWENIEKPGGKFWADHYLPRTAPGDPYEKPSLAPEEDRFKNLGVGTVADIKEAGERRLYKTAVPGFLLQFKQYDQGAHAELIISGHYILPERFEQMKEQRGK